MPRLKIAFISYPIMTKLVITNMLFRAVIASK